jgi:hypothetical protein
MPTTPLLARAGIAAALVLLAVTPLDASASTPASDAVTVPAAGGSVTVQWTGTVPVGPGTCGNGVAGTTYDAHMTTISVPTGLYSTTSTTATVSITWSGSADEALSVMDSSGNQVGVSDGSTNTETVTLNDPAADTYEFDACPSLANTAAVPYTGTLTVHSSALTAGFADAVQFTPATVVDPVLFGGEPGLHFDPTVGTSGSNSFVDWPVSSRQNIGVLFKSTDGGLSYTKRYADYNDPAEDGPACLGRQTAFCPSGGGGDTQIDINSGNGIVYMTSQESLANEAVGASFDHGLTFPASNVDPVASQVAGDVDRQWLADWKGTRTVFLAYHSPEVGEFVMRSDDAGATGSWHNASGAANVPQITGVVQSGALLADNTGGPNDHDLYVAYLGGLTNTPGFQVGVSTDGGKTFVSHSVPGAGNARNFTKIFMDNAGNLYATWADSSDQKTYLSTSLASAPGNVGAPASVWSKPVVVSDASQHVTIFPDGVAGSPGRIGIAYYGTTANESSPDTVKPGEGGWSPILAMSTNALCQWAATPCAAPTFTQSHIAHQINQDDNICTSGTACVATGGNRNLLDYFTPTLDSDGHIGVVWSDGTNQTKMPFVKVSRQATGPSLYAKGPKARLSMRGNGVPDPAGDAIWPFNGANATTGPNHPALDLLGTSVSVGGGNVSFTVKLADTSDLADAVPGGGTATDGLTPLQQAKYLVRWDFGGNTYYAEANLAAGSSTPTFGAGVVSSGEGLQAAGGTSPYGNTYQPLSAATGSVSSGKLTITVPASEVGSPKAGDTLISVGSYTLLGPVDSAATLNTAPITVDSTPTFDFAVPATTTTSTGTMGALLPLPVLGLIVAGYATVQLRRRRNRAAG